MEELKWTEGGLRKLSKTGRREVFSHPTMPGLVLLMTPAGVKTFYLVYRHPPGRAGKKRWFKIGVFGADGGLGWAEGEAERLRGQIRGGADPQGERVAQRKRPKDATLGDLCDRFLAYVDESRLAEATKKNYRRHVDKVIRPALGSRTLPSVGSAQVAALLQSLPPGEASHIRATLNRLFTRAILWEMATVNPVKGQDKPKADGRKGHRLTPEELRRLGQGIKAAPWQLRLTVLALALTGMRPGELVGSTYGGKEQRRWAEFDPKAGVLGLPTHKTVRHIGARRIYLCRQLVKILQAAPRDGDHILGGWSGATKAWADFRGACGLPHVVLYDLRHTYISTADELVTAATRAALVGHTRKDVPSRYTHKVEEELKAGAQKVGDAIARMLGL